MKKKLIYAIPLLLALALSSCENSEEQTGLSMATFSYENDIAYYEEETVTMNPSPFVNVDANPIDNQITAEKLAAKECSISYEGSSVYYDTETDMWRVDFYTVQRDEQNRLIGFSGDYQSVYLDSNGITQLVVVTNES